MFIVQFVLSLEPDDGQFRTALQTYCAVIDEDAIDNWKFSDVDRLFIRRLPVSILSSWITGEVDLANHRAFAASDRAVKDRVLIVSSPIMVLIETNQKEPFADAMCRVTNRYLPTSSDPLCYLATDGPRRTHIGDVLASLRDAGIDSVTALSFGQKASLRNYAWLNDIAVGRESPLNTVVEMDVAVNCEPIAQHEASVVVVCNRNATRWPGRTKHYRMFTELVRGGSSTSDFGTFQLMSVRDRTIKQVCTSRCVICLVITGLHCIRKYYTNVWLAGCRSIVKALVASNLATTSPAHNESCCVYDSK